VKIGLLGGLRVEHSGVPLEVTGSMQLAVLFRLAIDAGTTVSYRAIAEDVWSDDAPENTRAALQSIVSRLRAQLPPDVIESAPGGYRLAVARRDVDALVFVDLVAEASVAEPAAAATLASRALVLWAGEPWTPSDGFDWFVRDLERDRRAALALGGAVAAEENRSAIPAPVTSLVGRERELALVADQLDHNRLVTLLGTGGAGKTRLAVETARAQDGAVLVELAPVDEDEVLAAVLAATGREIRTAESTSEGSTPRDRVLDALAGRDVLLVLDNCEHVIGAVALVALDLLGALPRLRILATSREPVGIPGEAFVPVEPLDHPGRDRGTGPGALQSYSAVRLFAERAEAATGLPLDEEALAVGARICSRLDGLPLAIELAAAKLRTLTPDEILSGLDDRFTLLTGGRRAPLARHQTLRAVIDWSWSLLDDDERRALAWFSVFPAGADAGDIGGLAAAIGVPPDTFDGLVDRSLLQRSGGRFRALETIREYGIERLAAGGELEGARRAHVQHMVDSAQRHDAELRGPGVHSAIAWFDAEEDNIAGALRFAVESEFASDAVDLVTSCIWYWLIRDRPEETASWVVQVAPLAAGVDSDGARLIGIVSPLIAAFSGSSDPFGDESESRLLDVAATLPFFDVSADSSDVTQLAVTLLRSFASEVGMEGWMTRVQVPHGEKLGLGAWPTATLNVIRAATAQNRGDVEQLGEASEAAIDQFTGIGDWWGLALAQQMRSEWFSVRGDLEAALTMSRLATDNLRRITSSWDLAQQRALTVSLLLRLGRRDEAFAVLEGLLAEGEESGNIRTLATVVSIALTVSVSTGDAPAARRHLDRLDELVAELSSVPRQTRAIAEAGRAGIARLEGDWVRAELALREAIDHALASHDHPIIGQVTLELGLLAVDRGDIPGALRALDLASAIVGAEDATDPRVIAITRAAADAGVGRGDTSPTRPTALQSLRELLP
jgi:predicted ATPase